MRSFYVNILVICLVCGCSSRMPAPVNFQYSQQKKMQASSHWEMLAADLANRINNELILTDNIYKAVFVKETCGDETVACKPYETGSFNEAFRDLLITNLVEYGIPTKSLPDEDAIAVYYKVQVVHHQSDTVRNLQSGLLTSHYEIIITTSMKTDERYLFRASNIYYINDQDFYHYQESMPQTKTIVFSSGTPPQQSDIPGLLPTPLAATPNLDTGTNSIDATDM